jgi:hypothetical protein
MRLGWHVHLIGPFSLGGTVWRSKPRRRYKVLDCGHAHRTQEAYQKCRQRQRQRQLAHR